MLAVAQLPLTAPADIPYQNSLAAAIVLLALSLMLASGYQFRTVRTTVNPLTPDQTSQLVTNGIYAFSRNPMYVSFVLLLVALAIYLGHFYAYGLPLVFAWHITRVQIMPEETALHLLFGKEYEHYCANVRRWI